MSVESVTAVRILQDVQEKQQVEVNPNPHAPQTDTEAAIALGVRTVKKQARARTARIREVRARIEASAYQQDCMAIARKMLGIESETEDSPVP